MLRCCIRPNLRSCVRIDVGSSAAFLHASANLQAESTRKRTARATRKENRALKQDRQRLDEATKPSVVLGTRPGDEFKWLDCDLAKTIVAPDSSLEYDTLERPIGKVMLPKQLSWGVGEAEKALLFEALPPLSAEARVRVSPAESRLTAINEHVREAESVELEKTNTFAKLLDLRNADAGGIAYENRRRIIFEFSTPENPFDTGRPEVQAALLTYKIRNLWDHLNKFKRDVGNRRGLRKLVHQRAKILRYLKNVDRDRYDNVLNRLALEAEAVEGELIV